MSCGMITSQFTNPELRLANPQGQTGPACGRPLPFVHQSPLTLQGHPPNKHMSRDTKGSRPP